MSKIEHIIIEEIDNGFIATIHYKYDYNKQMVDHLTDKMTEIMQDEESEEWKKLIPKDIVPYSEPSFDPIKKIHFPNSLTLSKWILQTYPTKD